MTQGAKRYIIGKTYYLGLSDICSDTSQPRKYFDEHALAELKASILREGVLHPVLVRRGDNGRFVLVAGERRYQACLSAGLETIPAMLTDGDPLEISIVENLMREDLTAVEEAEALEHLKSTHDYQLSDLAAVLGKAQSTICEILSLNRLPDTVKDDCRNDPKAARRVLAEIAKQPSAVKMNALYRKYKESGLTRGEMRRKKSSLKGADDLMDLGFVERFVKRLAEIEIESLDRNQHTAFMACLDEARLTVCKKLKALKALPQSA